MNGSKVQKRRYEIGRLIGGGLVSTRELCDKLGVSFNTINSDKKALCDIGILETTGYNRTIKIQITKKGMREYGKNVDNYKPLTEDNKADEYSKDEKILDRRMSVLAYYTYDKRTIVKEIAKTLGVTQPTVSSDLKFLKHKRWVNSTESATEAGEMMLYNYDFNKFEGAKI